LWEKTCKQKAHKNSLGKFGEIWAKIICTPKNSAFFSIVESKKQLVAVFVLIYSFIVWRLFALSALALVFQHLTRKLLLADFRSDDAQSYSK